MPKYTVYTNVSIDSEIIEAENEEEAIEIAWEMATRSLQVYVEKIEEEEDE